MGTVDDYLETLEPDDRAAVAHVYDIARAEAPAAVQGMGYGMPALVHRGKPLLSVMRAKTHIGVYPFSPDAVAAVEDGVRAVEGSSLAKGTIRFAPEHPLPDEVVRALVRFRMDQIGG